MEVNPKGVFLLLIFWFFDFFDFVGCIHNIFVLNFRFGIWAFLEKYFLFLAVFVFDVVVDVFAFFFLCFLLSVRSFLGVEPFLSW